MNKRQNVRLLVADDHTVVRLGMRMALENKLDITNITEAVSCAELLNTLNRQVFTHLITDLMFKDGTALEIIPTIRSLHPSLPILVCSMLSGDIYAPVLQKQGVDYYLEKGGSVDSMIATLRQFIDNTGDRKSSKLLAKAEPSIFSELSERELQVLHYLLQGKNMVSIANSLNISSNTVYTFKRRIMEKTGAENMKELFELAKALEFGA